jgi:hypothetical protein
MMAAGEKFNELPKHSTVNNKAPPPLSLASLKGVAML